jgi:hypothetical protein
MMRTCPKCGDYYADAQLAFCLADGTPLVEVKPQTEKWNEGSRAIAEKTKRLNRKKYRRWARLIALGGLTTMVLALVVARSFTIETTNPLVASLTPSPSPLFSPAPSAEPSASPSPSPSPSPTPSPAPSASPYASPSPSASPLILVYQISGRVITDSQPVGGVKITLAGARTASTMTDGNGYYTFGELRAGGSFAVTPVTNRNITPPSRSFNNLRRDESADFSMPPEVFLIRGRVSSAAQPLSGIKITLEGSKLTSTTTDGGGNYSFGDLRAGGSYTITPRAQMSFKPASRSFDNLRRDESAEFIGAGKIEVTQTTTPPPECSDSEKESIGSNLVARFRDTWRKRIEKERSRIIIEAVKVDAPGAVANLGPIDFQTSVTKCSAVLVTAKYSWQVKADLPQGWKVVDVPKVKRFACGKIFGGWVCN